MAKLRVKLKQHTPLIHFQAQQEGATLRASELKPKLDRFLIKEVFDEDFDVYKECLLGYKFGKTGQDYAEKRPLDYKVRITPKSEKIIAKPHRLYFGNMGNTQPLETVYYKGDILLDFFSLNNAKLELHQGSKTILDVIAENIDGFFAVTNFGSRQSKGFGSFFVAGEDEKYISILEKIKRQFIYIKYDHKNPKNMMDNIAIIYQLIKSGLNFPENKNKGFEASYHRSFLFNYMNAKGIGNEKRFIKEKFFKLPTRNSDNKKQYVRAMLGTCEGITFKGNVVERKVSYKNNEIQRFRSPITFKIVGNYLAFISGEMTSEIFSKEFNFSDGVQSEKISTPASFDLAEFLFAFADYFNDELEVTTANNPFENGLRKIKEQVILKAGDNND